MMEGKKIYADMQVILLVASWYPFPMVTVNV